MGTLFKEMKLKPSIVLDSVSLLGKKAQTNYLDESDTLLIEDQSGRMKIMVNEIMNPANFVTGSVVALKGRANSNGLFEANDFTYAGIPSLESVPDGFDQQMDEEVKEQRPLFEDIENRTFIAFVSGLQFGNGEEKLSTELLTRFLLGQIGTREERILNSRVVRIVVGGNSIGEETDIDEVIKGSYR